MTDSERDPDPAPEQEALPAAPDGPLAPDEVDGDPEDEARERAAGG